MGTVLLVRHGLTALTGPVLAGWTPGVHLDDRGLEQARSVADRLAALPLAAVVSSPLERCRETAGEIAGRRGLPVQLDERLGECRYGAWTGRELKALAKDPLWRVVQVHPSAVRFPDGPLGEEGETLPAVQSRAVSAVRDWDTRLGPDALWVAASHGDVIKAITADALGLHLDLFQRITVDPCSVTAIRYTELRPFVLRMNDGADLSGLAPPARSKRRRSRRTDSEAAVGGGAGGGQAGST
ncbi:MAG: histidine phosphatase family protein [Mycobacteriales bacterium]